MNNLTRLLIVFIFSSSLFMGCASTREESGAMTGALAGAAIGSAIGDGRGKMVAIWLGAVLGTQVGATIGKYMDEQDRQRLVGVLETQRSSTTSTWINPDTGYRYNATPIKTYDDPVGPGPCREFTLDAIIGGKTQQIYGTACRQADGSWKVIK